MIPLDPTRGAKWVDSLLAILRGRPLSRAGMEASIGVLTNPSLLLTDAPVGF